jgi:hypothetical protein
MAVAAMQEKRMNQTTEKQREANETINQSEDHQVITPKLKVLTSSTNQEISRFTLTTMSRNTP